MSDKNGPAPIIETHDIKINDNAIKKDISNEKLLLEKIKNLENTIKDLEKTIKQYKMTNYVLQKENKELKSQKHICAHCNKIYKGKPCHYYCSRCEGTGIDIDGDDCNKCYRKGYYKS